MGVVDVSRALFEQACRALEEGAIDNADATAARLHVVAPGRPEVGMLAALISQRRQSPDGNWVVAFVRAWNAAGRPNLQDSTLLPVEESDDEGAGSGLDWVRTTKADARLVVALAGGLLDEGQQRWLASHISEVSNPVLLRAAFEYFQGDALVPEVRGDALAVLRPRLVHLSRVVPTEMQTPLILLLQGRALDAPMTTGELEDLERVASLPDYRVTPLVQMHSEAEQLLKSMGVGRPELRAFSVSVSELALTGPYLLWRRAEMVGDTLSSPDRARLGHVLWDIGKRVAEESTLVERMVGLRLMRQGAELLNSSEMLKQVALATQQGKQVAGVSSALQFARWPLPSLQRAWLAATLENEWVHLQSVGAPSGDGM
ncbi:hypothetical protein DRW03_35630 [Corallococcus sp. H22C18031201]|nr:hypothetical protein DRW03_35630 [Corallococcus sp. H22C18031201]